ncbi:MAG TPA: SDR family NAD(P)-dependent oxidoreductase [Acidimicrobiales bacterium]|jgi:NAD(P)-dependent dehydrogenase (short-subunit alcohol dehydrogenase family)|nr:SDR family NAD(P)-dependent oxidoreductase [Acidimicrobiales bacterium]
MDYLTGRRALITGAGGAIGRASALTFAREGCRVAAVDIVRDAVMETVALVEDAGGEAVAIVADVADESQVRAAVDSAARSLGGLDALFNNAGIMPHQDESILQADVDLWDLVFNVNVRGTVNFTKWTTPHLVAAGGGSILNMSSFLAFLGCSHPQDAYTASKGAIAAMTRALAVQLGPQHVRVNALAPGPIATPHVEAFFAEPEERAIRLARYPLGRFGTVQDVAELACFLTSEVSSWLTGQVVVLDGGASINYV